ncbi:non-specific lipid-transfer protein-like protein At2g13820 isoform X2 [Quercus lobata]|uniref:non-specific lipid-transfer protein-like protein At2g13820 isoform X2 n=1 Tax=Quercus lobata TaxID=97700 RepID=UPI001246DBDA|nr:non-specific lipid-transfer protein-like protein At2g13820 isoform X2 [Quercus lobata]
MAFPSFVPMLALIVVLIIPVYGQINSPCSASMISSFSPCMGFVTNSSANGTSPTADCCNSLKSLTSGGMGCLCLILTGNVPFQIPINRTMAISLPSACNMAGVPVQCKASASPLPAPGPISLAPTPLPEASSPSPKEPPTSPALAPEADTTPLLTPPSTTSSEAPTATTGSRPVLTPSSAMPSHSLSSSLLLFALGLFVMSYC